MAESEFKVVFAFDDSEIAENAFKWYKEFLHKDEHQLLLLHCVEPLTMVGEVPSVDLYENMLDDCRQKAKRLEEKYGQLMKEYNMKGKIVAMFGSKPGEIVVDTATKEKAKMILCGSRGLGKFRRTVLGSVSDYILHHAHCPVVVCKH